MIITTGVLGATIRAMTAAVVWVKGRTKYIAPHRT
jgi:hypothetical protein